MELPVITYSNGLSAFAVALVATIFGIMFYLRYRKEKKYLMLFVSLLFFTFLGLYLGPVVTFWSLIFTGVNINSTLFAQLSYTVAPLALINSIWLGFSIFNPKNKKVATIIYGLTAIPFYISLYGFPSIMIREDIPVNTLNAAGLMLDVSYTSLMLGILSFYIWSAIILLGIGFLKLRFRVGGAERKRATYLSIGAFLFGFAGVLETWILPALIMVARIVMIMFLLFDYAGWWARITPKPGTPTFNASIKTSKI